MTKKPALEPDAYWERAGELSYAEAMFACGIVAQHINRRLWKSALDFADTLGVPSEGRVLDFGCGDGAFANGALAGRYNAVDGLDKAKTAIERARKSVAGPHVNFAVADLTKLDYGAFPRYDGVFFMSVLHHIKQATPDVVRAIAQVTNRVIVLEPNGNNLLRKMLELTPSHRAAGEDSFRTNELIDIFTMAGFRTVMWRRMNLFPNFMPGSLFRMLAWLEPHVEASSFWNALCTVNVFAFSSTKTNSNFSPKNSIT
jgi:SAM-dependent methyltransferase